DYQCFKNMTNVGLKVFAPASVANVACGYDVLGLALEKPGDEIYVRFSNNPGFRITKITGGKLPYEPEKNTAGFAALKMLEHLEETGRGIEMEIHKKMPFGSGLGSSAASAAGAVMAINELLGRPLTKREMLPFAVQGEQVADGAYHADNVAPSLLGGFVLIRDNETLDVHRLPAIKGLQIAIVHPKIEILTKYSRSVLSDQVSLKQMIKQTGSVGGLVTAMFKGDLELLQRSLQDVVIEPQRAQLIPGFYKVQEAAINAGALGCSISGAGPSIFAICPNNFVAENAGVAMQEVFKNINISSTIFLSGINHEGAVLI
ncbi:MAG: homoserine kinase, partial [Flavobacteriales bacterium]